MNNTKRIKVQVFLTFILVFVVLKSNYFPLTITAYLTIVPFFLSTFNFIRDEEMKKTKENDKSNFWAQTITFIIFQTLSLAFIFLISWYVFAYKFDFQNSIPIMNH